MEASQVPAHSELKTIPVEIIDQTEQFRRLRVKEPTKEATARTLAMVLVWGFVVAVVLCLTFGFYLLVKSPSIDEKSLAASTEFLKVTSSIFAPLLAFVLGYYFSKREE